MRSNGRLTLVQGLARHVIPYRVSVQVGRGLHECGIYQRKKSGKGSKAFSALQWLQGRHANHIKNRALSERAELDASEIGHRM